MLHATKICKKIIPGSKSHQTYKYRLTTPPRTTYNPFRDLISTADFRLEVAATLIRIFRFFGFFDLIPSANFQDVFSLNIDDVVATPTPVGLVFTPAAAFVSGGTVVFPLVPSLD